MLKITPIPAFTDNYIWLLQDRGQSWVVDPGDPKAVTDALGDTALSGILITHHHLDHTGGLQQLRETYDCPVYGPATIEGITNPIADGDRFELMGCPVEVRAVPGHTLDHLALIIAEGDIQHLFCGDTLFAGGCGRLFEGTPEQMWDSLDGLAELPEDTLVYCAHEYTAANLNFARVVEPDNQALQSRIGAVESVRARGRATLPSTIGVERETNPFLRCREEPVQAAAASQGLQDVYDPASVFRCLRQWKDNF